MASALATELDRDKLTRKDKNLNAHKILFRGYKHVTDRLFDKGKRVTNRFFWQTGACKQERGYLDRFEPRWSHHQI